MNERIKQLWSQAGGHYNSGNQHTWPQYTIDDPAKFAQLIVQECAGIARKVGSKTKPADFALDRCYEIEEKIKEHFGVEP
jgi:hypothetical protein